MLLNTYKFCRQAFAFLQRQVKRITWITGFGSHLSRAVLIALSCTLLLSACERKPVEEWRLTSIEKHLPDLNFSLTSDQGQPVTAKNYQGNFVLVYFGYTHCPDICPETMTRLLQVLQKIGNDAQKVRILFISVDPTRDTPKSLHTYLSAFDAQHIVGLTGTVQQIEALAKTYRVAYEAGPTDAHENYEVMHSSAIYIFDAQGRAQLMATGSDSADNIAHDLRILIQK